MAGLWSYKPQNGGSIASAPTKAEHSPIDGREPAFEAGDVGSTPARGTHGGRGVLVCTPRCERGGNGFNPLRSPITGCGSMAGHLARNQVNAGSIPATQTNESADEWSSTGPENRGGGAEPQRFDSSALVCRVRLVGEDAAPSRRKRGFKSRTRRKPPTATGSRPALRTQALEVRVLSWVPNWTMETCWSGNRPVCSNRGPTIVARVRFAPSPLAFCTAVRAARTRSSKPASRVRLPGGTRTACVGPVMPHGVAGQHVFIRVAKWQRRRLLTVLPQVRILPLVPLLVRYASGKRGGCLPPKASSILVRTATFDSRSGSPTGSRQCTQNAFSAGSNPAPSTRTCRLRRRRWSPRWISPAARR